ARRSGHDDHVGLVDRARNGVSVDERRDLVADAELEAARGRGRAEADAQRALQPALLELGLLRRWAERPHAPEGELVAHQPKPGAVLRQLVDGRRVRWREPALLHHAAGLEPAQARGEDVGAAAVEPLEQIGITEWTVDQLA